MDGKASFLATAHEGKARQPGRVAVMGWRGRGRERERGRGRGLDVEVEVDVDGMCQAERAWG